MKKMKTLLAGICAVGLAFALSACGNGSNSGNNKTKSEGKDLDQASKDEIAKLKDQLPTKELKNKTIKWMAHYDINPGKGATKSPGLELFEQAYDGKVEWVQTTWDTRYEKLSTSVSAKNSPDFFPASDMDSFPKGAINNWFQPIDGIVDLDNEIWKPSKDACDKFIFDGKHYVAVINIEPNYVCTYNKTAIAQNNLEDPAQLFADGKWDWNTFAEMCNSFTDGDNDKYGLDGYWYGKALSETSGVPMIGLEDGNIVNNMADPAVEKAQDFMYDLQKNGVCFPRCNNDSWHTRGDGTTGNGLGTYETLFIPVGLWALEDSLDKTAPFGDMASGEIMFVPMPKNPDSDTYYISSRIQGYNLCQGAPNPEGFAAYMDCLMLCRENTKAITEKTLMDDYKWTQEMIDMRNQIYDMANENPVFDLQNGINSEMDQYMQVVSQATMITGGDATTWTQCRSENEKAVDYIIKDVNKQLEENKK